MSGRTAVDSTDRTVLCVHAIWDVWSIEDFEQGANRHGGQIGVYTLLLCPSVRLPQRAYLAPLACCGGKHGLWMLGASPGHTLLLSSRLFYLVHHAVATISYHLAWLSLWRGLAGYGVENLLCPDPPISHGAQISKAAALHDREEPTCASPRADACFITDCTKGLARFFKPSVGPSSRSHIRRGGHVLSCPYGR
ncbi:hypothetical protein VTN02DRAFT_1659 [Thermoascus thermophilus]